MKRFAITVALVLIVLPSVAMSAEKSKSQYTVGIMFRLNEKFDRSVTALVDGIELAKHDFEKKNPGLRITLKRYSHDADLASVVKAANQVVTDGVPAVIGGELSEEALVSGEILNSNRIVFLTPTSSNPSVTAERPFVFRACFSDSAVASAMAKFTLDHLQPEKIGVIHNVSSPYSNYLTAEFVKSIARIQDGPVKKPVDVLVSKVVKGTFDFEPIVNEFSKNKVSHVVLLTHDSDVLQFTAAAAKKRFFPTYIGSDGWGSNEGVHRTFVKESAAGEKFVAYRNSYWHQESKNPNATQFKKNFLAKYNRSPTAWSAMGYDSAMMLFLSIKQSGDPNSAHAIRKSLKAFTSRNLVTTPFMRFNSQNSPDKDLVIYRIDRGGIQHQAVTK